MNGKSDNFTYAELEMLSDGILSMMENTNKAMTLTKNLEIHKLMACDLEKWSALNAKISRMTGEMDEGCSVADERECSLDGLVKEKDHVDAKIADSPLGYKMMIPLFNKAVPSYYKGNALKAVEAFMEAYALSYGAPLKAGNIYVDGNLSVCLDRKTTIDKKYRLYIVIMIEGDQDYVIEVPVLPTDKYFGEFRQCILNEFKAMVDGI